MQKSLIGRLAFSVGASLFVSICFSSCVSTKDVHLSAADRAAMRGKTFTVTSRKMPSHSVMKPSTVAAGMLGGAVGGAIAGSVAEQEGKGQIEKHRIENPNERMNRELAKVLVAKTGAKQIPSKQMTSSLDPKSVAKDNAHADYVLDCFTTSWTGAYYPMHLTKYFIMMGLKMQLVETSSGRVVAEGFSTYQGKDLDHAPNYDGIYANGASFLKGETNRAVAGAIGKFSGQL